MKPIVFTEQIIDCSLIDKQHMYGSRRLGVHTSQSDYDLFFHSSEIATIGLDIFQLKKKKKEKKLINNSNYLSSKPLYGTVKLIKNMKTVNKYRTADILIFSDKRDIEIMNKALNYLENGATLLYDKSLRINVYNYALQHFGFLPINDKTYLMYTKKVFDLIGTIKKSNDIHINSNFEVI